MSFEFGVFHEFPRYAGVTDAEAFTQSFVQVDAAERWGLDVIWIAELHFLPERSVASAPLLIASAIASQTRRMKIGIAVQVLPLCHPLRLAEEVATLDHISRGRLVFGVGRSGFPHTYEAYGIPYGESRERFAEVLEILKRCWLRSASPSRGSFTGFTMSQSSRGRCRSHIRRCASQRRAQTPIGRSAPWACPSSLPSASVRSKNWGPA
jgi:Coenzyme F420-dependent N5,N10-methylene tetrahydromethanopterin reductase and related flavin-dependent oxidoreductases